MFGINTKNNVNVKNIGGAIANADSAPLNAAYNAFVLAHSETTPG